MTLYQWNYLKLCYHKIPLAPNSMKMWRPSVISKTLKIFRNGANWFLKYGKKWLSMITMSVPSCWIHQTRGRCTTVLLTQKLVWFGWKLIFSLQSIACKLQNAMGLSASNQCIPMCSYGSLCFSHGPYLTK